jgi:hypothetical protein
MARIRKRRRIRSPDVLVDPRTTDRHVGTRRPLRLRNVPAVWPARPRRARFSISAAQAASTPAGSSAPGSSTLAKSSAATSAGSSRGSVSASRKTSCAREVMGPFAAGTARPDLALERRRLCRALWRTSCGCSKISPEVSRTHVVVRWCSPAAANEAVVMFRRLRTGGLVDCVAATRPSRQDLPGCTCPYSFASAVLTPAPGASTQRFS